MTNHISIQFILQELTNNAEYRERFSKTHKKEIVKLDKTKLVFALDTVKFDTFEFVGDFQQTAIIRTALSRVDGKAVLGALEGEVDIEYFARGLYRQNEKNYISGVLYFAFDTPLRNGEGLEKALTTLNQYFVEEGKIVKLKIK